MQLSVIVPVHRGGEKLRRLVDSLDSQVGAPSFELILVMNPPDPALADEFSRRPEIRCFNTAVIGANNARNIGVEAAKGEVLLFVDDDCLMHRPGFMHGHWRAHGDHPELSGIGGIYDIAPESGSLARAYHLLQSAWLHEAPQPGYRAELLLGGNMSFKRAAFSSERFHNSLAFGGTETELVFRLAAAGQRTKLLEGLAIQHGPTDKFLQFLLKAVKQGCGAAFLKNRNYYGVPLVRKGADSSAPETSGMIWLMIFLHRAFFRAGLSRGRFTGPWPSAQMLAAGCWETFKEPVGRGYYLVFVEIWGALLSSILLRKLGLVGARERAARRTRG